MAIQLELLQTIIHCPESPSRRTATPRDRHPNAHLIQREDPRQRPCQQRFRGGSQTPNSNPYPASVRASVPASAPSAALALATLALALELASATLASVLASALS